MKIQCYDYDINDALDNGVAKMTKIYGVLVVILVTAFK